MKIEGSINDFVFGRIVHGKLDVTTDIKFG